MRYRRISSLIALTTLIFTVSQPPANFPGLFQASQVLAQTPELRKAEAVRLSEQGIEQFQSNQFDAAFQSWLKALTISQEIKDRNLEGIVLSNLGRAYYLQGKYAKAIEYLQQQLAITREIQDLQTEAKTLAYLGLASLYLSDYAKGIDYLQQQLANARSLNDRQAQGAALGNLGIAYDSLGEYAKAIEYHQQLLAIAKRCCEAQIAREIKDRQSEGKALGNLGLAYLSLDDYSKAIDHQKQWLAIAKRCCEAQIAQETKDRQSEGNALGNLGLAYLALGDYTKALDYQKQWLAIAKRCCEAQIAREIKDRQSEGKALSNLGIVYTVLSDYAKANEHLQQSLVIAQEINDLDGEGKALNNLGASLLKSGNLAEAETILRTGIDARESLRKKLGNNDAFKVSIFEDQAKTYLLLQKVLIAQNKTDEALETAERGRARAFLDLLQERLSTKGSKEVIQPEQPTTKPTIQLLQKIAKQQNATLVEYSIIYDEFKAQDKLQTKESKLYIWVIKPTGEITFRQSDLTPLWQQQNTSLVNLVTTTRGSIGVDDRSIFQAEVVNPVDEENQTKRLQQLHQLLIAPIADLLPTDPNQRVIFVPQKELFLVPFAALQEQEGKYLIEKHTILTAPSIQVLESTRASWEKVKQAAAKDALVLGNPTMPKVAPKYGEKAQLLANLPGAKKEAEAIAPLFNTKALTGDAATKAAVLAKIPQAKIIHLATHGLFDDFQGLQSAVALAPTSSDNGLLTAEEILNLKLNADLVVLSACNTGRGRITGDGVIGLSRSLFIAGTPSVIVSLWSVPDAPTASLMTEFYNNLYQKKLDKAQALRMAMLKIMEKHRNSPRAWAAFTLIGEAQ
ncbi:MAG TPA: CHAT domain-containing protein [Coleofasciculaceae cyanobacterium]|jgi:CHAT domain-containing protein/Flp pilus assembly protein TadD